MAQSEALLDVGARTAVASVAGSSRWPYTVNVAAPVIADGLLRVACTCPVGERLEATCAGPGIVPASW